MGLFFFFFESSTFWYIHDLEWNVHAGTLPKDECIWNGAEKRDFRTMDQKEEVAEGDADTGAGCLWSSPQAQRLTFSINQEELRMPPSLINHNYVNAGCRARTEGCFRYAWYMRGERC